MNTMDAEHHWSGRGESLLAGLGCRKSRRRAGTRRGFSRQPKTPSPRHPLCDDCVTCARPVAARPARASRRIHAPSRMRHPEAAGSSVPDLARRHHCPQGQRRMAGQRAWAAPVVAGGAARESWVDDRGRAGPPQTGVCGPPSGGPACAAAPQRRQAFAAPQASDRHATLPFTVMRCAILWRLRA